jgi:hypothetical protein
MQLDELIGVIHAEPKIMGGTLTRRRIPAYERRPRQ